MTILTLDGLKKIVPLAGHRAELAYQPLIDTMIAFGIDTVARQAAFIAQVAHESGSFRYTAEIASGMAYNEREDLGNTKPEAIRIAALYGSLPGKWWKGHGWIQVTGFNNHKLCGKALGLDLLNKPSLLEIPIYAAKSAGWFWIENDLNKWADAGDIDGVSDVVNRGHKTARIGDALGYAERAAFFERGLIYCQEA